jgi:hypothetical protein
MQSFVLEIVICVNFLLLLFKTQSNEDLYSKKKINLNIFLFLLEIQPLLRFYANE